MALIESTGIIGNVLNSLTLNVTGSWFLTLFILVVAVVIIASALRLPFWITIPIVFPLLLVAVVMESALLPVIAVAILYLSIVFAKAFFF